MWTIFAENPLLIAIMIAGVVVALVWGWLQTGDKRVALAAFIVALLIPGSYFLSESIVTDREQILDSIYATAEAVEQNDHTSAVMVVVDNETRQRALAELPKYEFHRVGVRNIQIKFVEGSLPREATVDLDASVRLSQVRGSIQNITVPRRVILTFEQQPDGTWAVTDYTHRPLTGAADQFTPNTVQQ